MDQTGDDKAVRQICAHVAAITRRKGEAHIAMVRRTEEGADVWALPGGHVEERDGQAVLCARRKLFEGTSIIVSAGELRVYDFLDAAARDPHPGTPRASVIFHVEIHESDASDGDTGAAAFRWIPLDKIVEDMVGFDHRYVIQRLRLQYK